MVAFILSVLIWKYSFWVNLVQKTKIVSLSWNLVLRLIRIWRIWWCYSFFVFLTRYILFRRKLFQKQKTVETETEPKPIRICRTRWWFSFFFFFRSEILFWVNLGQKLKIFSLTWNLVPKRKFDIDIHFFCFRPFFASFFPKISFLIFYVTWLISQQWSFLFLLKERFWDKRIVISLHNLSRKWQTYTRLTVLKDK